MTKTMIEWTRRFLGLSNRTPEQDVTYLELMNLSDRQLADIGLNRAMVQTVVVQGQRHTFDGLGQDSAVARIANMNRPRLAG